MRFTAMAALVRKDLKIFFGDRRAVIMSFAAPIVIASFFGYLFAGSGSSAASRIPVQVADQDHSKLSREIVQALTDDDNLKVTAAPEATIRDEVRRGHADVGIVMPAGFGETAGRSFFTGADKPTLRLLYDPSKGAELGMVRGILTEHVMQSVSKEMFTGQAGRQMIDQSLQQLDRNTKMAPADRSALRDMLQSVQRWYGRVDTDDPAAGGPATGGLSVPYTVDEQAITARQNVALQRLRPRVLGDGRAVRAVHLDRDRRGHPAGAPAGTLEAAAQRPAVEDHAARRRRRRAAPSWRCRSSPSCSSSPCSCSASGSREASSASLPCSLPAR